MIKTLETNVVKGKFIGRDGQPSIREYTFYVDEDVSVGDVLEVLSPSQSFGSSFKVTAAYLPDGTAVDDCKRVQERYTLPCPVELSPGDILRRRKV